MEVENFGGNISLQPTHRYQPASEQEVLEILRTNRGRRIRTVGRLHSWSNVLDCDDVLLDLRRLDSVHIDRGHGRTTVTIGAGCQLKRAVAELDRAGLALPSQGLILEQTIAGAISTGTHGSGKNSLSHYVEELTVAMCDPQTGEPIVRTIREGRELLAARCSLGCTGVILSAKLTCRPQYQIEEHFRFYDELGPVLAAEDDFPLQQFFLLPHSWRFMAQHRRESEERRSALSPFYHAYWFASADVGLHLLLLSVIRVLRSRRLVRMLFRHIVPWTIVRGWKVVDKSQRMLTMRHELFRHIEIELFVRASKLADMLAFVRPLLEYCDGASTALDDETWGELSKLQLSHQLQALCGSYTHHYPICIRKVLPDETLISMASSDDEPYYAVSLICYNRPREREDFLALAHVLAHAAAHLFDARPHWGKWCPIDAELAQRLYPRLTEFQQICATHDSKGAFRNRWVDEVLFSNGSPLT